MLRSNVFRSFLASDLRVFPQFYSVSATAANRGDIKAEAPYSIVDYDKAKPYDSIPGPTPLPIIGNAWRLFGEPNFVKIQKEMHKKYGDIVRLRKMVGFGDMTSIYNTRDMEYMFRNEGQWPNRISLPSVEYYRYKERKDIFGDTYGLLNGQGEDWGTFRTAVNPIMMQPRTTHQFIPEINEIADEFIEYVKIFKQRNANGEMPETFLFELNKWAFESITAIALDTRLGVLAEKPNESARKAIRYSSDIFGLAMALDVLPSGKFHRKFNTKTWKRYVEAQDYFTNLALDLIDQAKKRIDNDPDYANKLEHDKSVFERLVAIDKKIAIIMTLDLLQAGIDTTSKIMAAALYYLAKYPDAQEKLRAELKRLLPTKNTPITKEILDEAKYLRACVKEALRLAPITLGNTRIMTKDIVLGGYQIPKGSMVTVPNLYLCTAVDTHYSNPSAYMPERWLRDEKTENVNAFISLPFGFGPRSCIGKRMASMEIEVLLSKMIRNVTLEWPHKDMAFRQDPHYGIADPLKLRLKDVSD